MSPLFCACLLLRRKRVQTLVRRQLRDLLERRLKIVYTEPTSSSREEVRRVFSFVASLFRSSTDSDMQRTKRLDALRRLEQFFAGPISDGESIPHYCPLGCHSSRESAVKEVYDDIVEVFLAHPPAVPAYNKWNKLYPPIAWFASFCCLHFILPGSVQNMMSLLRDQLENANLEAGAAASLEGLNDQATFLAQEQVRFRKTSRFLNAVPTPDKLAAISTVLRIATALLGTFFEGASRYKPSPSYSLLPLSKPTSPALSALRKCAQLLDNQDDPAWKTIATATRQLMARNEPTTNDQIPSYGPNPR